MELLQAIPNLLSLLAGARYIDSSPDRRRYADVRSVNLDDLRRLYLLAATAEIAGRPIELLFAVRENFGGQGFLDRIVERGAVERSRRAPGGALDDPDLVPNGPRNDEFLLQVGAKPPRMTCVKRGNWTAGTYYPYCPNCYKKSLDPDGGVVPIVPIPNAPTPITKK